MIRCGKIRAALKKYRSYTTSRRNRDITRTVRPITLKSCRVPIRSGLCATHFSFFGVLRSKSLQKSDQSFFIFGREIEAEVVALHREGFGAVRLEAGGNVVVAHAPGVEPIFQSCAPAVVPEHAAVPNAL